MIPFETCGCYLFAEVWNLKLVKLMVLNKCDQGDAAPILNFFKVKITIPRTVE